MGRTLEAFVRYLQQKGWHYALMPDQHTVLMRLQIENGVLTTLVQETDGRLILQSTFPFHSPSQKQQVVSRFAQLANVYHATGELVVDRERGAILFESWLDIPDSLPTLGELESLIVNHLTAVDRYIPALALVCFSDIAPQVAFAQYGTSYTPDEAIAIATDLLNHVEQEE